MSSQLVVVSFLDKVPTEEFMSSDWPLHVTLLPPFFYSGHLEGINNGLDNIAKNTKPFSVKTSGEALFGPNEDIPVSIIEPNHYLSELHLKLADLALMLGFTCKHPLLSENRYRFHVTTQNGQKASAETDIPINGFSLVDRLAKNKSGLKKVIKSFDFT